MQKQSDNNYKGILLIRVLAGLVLLADGFQKCTEIHPCWLSLFPAIRMPAGQMLATFTGVFEVVLAVLLFAGLCVQYIAVPLIFLALTSIACSKIAWWADTGFWAATIGGQSSFLLLLTFIFLMIYGAGRYSLDAYFRNSLSKNS